MIQETIKIQINKPNATFSEREKYINTEIQKIIDSYNNKGFNVLSHSVKNKTNSFATVEFDLFQVPR
jgi:hypothetical protein